jgi:hypothetical protein
MLALNRDPLNLCLPGSWDYLREQPHLANFLEYFHELYATDFFAAA